MNVLQRAIYFYIVKVKLHLRDGQTDERTDAGNIIWCILALTVIWWWQLF